MPHILLDGNTNRLLAQGLSTRNVTTGAVEYLNATDTVTVTLLDHETQLPIVGGSWPQALSYIAGSTGDFHAPIRADVLTLAEFQTVDAQIAVNAGIDQIGFIVLECIVEKRRE